MALPRIARDAFWHAGQACVGVQRVFCHRSIAQDVAVGLGRLGEKMTIGDPLLKTTAVGPLISHKENERVARWVSDAVADGAGLVSGGSKVSDSCYANTVLLDPPMDADVTRKEIFGPVVCVYSYDDIDTAIGYANDLPYSFQAAVFTRNMSTGDALLSVLRRYCDHGERDTLFRVDWMPFAGARVSGHGVGGIPYTMHEMQTEKMMVWRSDALN